MEVLASGEDVLLLGTGTGVALCTEAARLLRGRGYAPTVANVRRIQPLDEEALLELLATHSRVVTVEENVLAGGFGSSILEVLQKAGLERSVARVGLPDQFVGHGDLPSLYRSIGFTAQRVALAAEALLPARASVAGEG